MQSYRKEKDTMGVVEVPANVYWGAQTQRSIDNFRIAQDINRMPKEIVRAFAYLKKAAALANLDAGVLPKEKCDLIGQVCDEILAGKLDDQFPLVVWQTGSGTQTHSYIGVMFRRLRSAPVCRWRCIWIMGTALNYAHRRCARGIPA